MMMSVASASSNVLNGEELESARWRGARPEWFILGGVAGEHGVCGASGECGERCVDHGVEEYVVDDAGAGGGAGVSDIRGDRGKGTGDREEVGLVWIGGRAVCAGVVDEGGASGAAG